MKLTVGVDFQKRDNDVFTEDGLHTNHTALQSYRIEKVYYQVLDGLLPLFFQNGSLTSQCAQEKQQIIAINGNQQILKLRNIRTYSEEQKNMQLSKQGCIGSIIKKQIEQSLSQNELGTYHVMYCYSKLMINWQYWRIIKLITLSCLITIIYNDYGSRNGKFQQCRKIGS